MNILISIKFNYTNATLGLPLQVSVTPAQVYMFIEGRLGLNRSIFLQWSCIKQPIPLPWRMGRTVWTCTMKPEVTSVLCIFLQWRPSDTFEHLLIQVDVTNSWMKSLTRFLLWKLNISWSFVSFAFILFMCIISWIITCPNILLAY